MEIPQLYDVFSYIIWDQVPYETPAQVFNEGYPYTSFIIDITGQNIMTLNGRPRSAFEYCFNRNKRDADGSIKKEYKRYWAVSYVYEETSNESKWFLPGIRQMEDALTQYYTTFGEFQTSYYWSASAGEEAGGSDGQNPQRARATKVDLTHHTGYAQSGGGGESGDYRQYAYEYGNGGYALRTEVLRIRAFRVDLNPVD